MARSIAKKIKNPMRMSSRAFIKSKSIIMANRYVGALMNSREQAPQGYLSEEYSG
jgi:hypothetical protein